MRCQMLSGPQRKFCEGIVAGLNGTDAYCRAYPKSSRAASRARAPILLAKDSVQTEITRLRAKADEKAGSAVLTLAEKRSFVARLVRAKVADLPPDSDLFNSVKRSKDGIEFRLPDKLRAIELDNDLAGDGSEAGANDALSELLNRVMK